MAFLKRLGYLLFTTFNERVLFYFAWTMSDLVCNSSGLGFNGYDENGAPRWDLLKNFDFLKLEVR